MKSRAGQRQREEKDKKREDQRRERVRRKQMQMREKVGKSRNTVFFQWFVAREGQKVGLLKRRVRSQLARWEMKKCTPVVARSTLASQNVQNTPGSDHFWKLRCRKSARRCGAKMREAHFQVKMYKTPASDHFWKLRCRKSVRRCGAKHISKSKCRKHTTFGALLEVPMSKKCTPLWREAHFEVKMLKTLGFGPLLEVQMSKKCTPLWRKAHFEVNMLKTLGVRTTFGGSDVASLHYNTLHYTTLHYLTLHYTPQHYNYNYTTTLHYTSTTLHYTSLH